MYLLPLHNDQDIGARAGAVTGVYAPEYNNQFSYAYTYGDAHVRFPQAGTGQFIANVRMGGPNGAVPVTAYLETPHFRVRFGPLKDIRVYHVLIPASPEGDVEFHLPSTTTQIKADPRHLGVLLDWVQLRTVSMVAPPEALLLGTPLVLALLWITIRQLHTPEPFKIGLLLLCSALLCASFALSRGRLTLPAWWLIAADLFVMAVIGLTRFDEWRLSKPLFKIAALLALWRAGLWLVSAVGTWYSSGFYEYGKKITSGGAIIDRNNFVWRFLADAWVGWDGGHYRNIAVNGYSFLGNGEPTIAFFPLYPLLIRLFLPITSNNAALASLIVSHLALFAALLLIYDLVSRDFDHTLADRTIVLLLIFPASFYFVSAYSESLGLALLVATLWAMRKQRWWLAGIAGGLLALTRLPGVFVAPVLACAYLQQHRWRWRSIGPDFLAVLLPPLGIVLFMLYQWWRFGTPVAFLIAQRHWGNHLEPPWTIPHILLTTITTAGDWPIRVFQLVVWVSFIGLMLFALLRLPLPYGLTVLLLVPPYLSPWHGSFPRYVLIGFPAFIVMAMFAKQRWIYTLMVSAMLAALAIGVLLFTNGFWVA
jgi:hypothetical protein